MRRSSNLIVTLFAHKRSWLQHFPSLQRQLREHYMRRRAWAIRIDDDTVLCRLLGRWKIYVYAADRHISHHLMIDGYWEPETTKAIMDLVPREGVVIDVGANLGYFTIIMGLLVGPRGRVIAFEPNPRTAEYLRASLRLNGMDRIEVHEEAVGEDDIQGVDFYAPVGDPGGTQRTALTPAGANFIKVRTRRMDSVPGALDAALVKIDAEGMEEAIWRGMTAMIAGRKLRVVIMEFTPASYADPHGLLDDVEAAGFRLACVDPDVGARPITRAEIFDGTTLRMLVFQR